MATDGASYGAGEIKVAGGLPQNWGENSTTWNAVGALDGAAATAFPKRGHRRILGGRRLQHVGLSESPWPRGVPWKEGGGDGGAKCCVSGRIQFSCR